MAGEFTTRSDETAYHFLSEMEETVAQSLQNLISVKVVTKCELTSA